MPYIQERATADGEVRYRVQVRLKGHPVRTNTFKRKTDARRWGQQIEAAIREGRDFNAAESKKHSLGELIDRYIENVLPLKPRSQVKQTAQLTWWSEQLGEYSLDKMTPALIAECRDKLLRGSTSRGTKRAPATVVRYIAVLSHAFTIAVKEWGWVEVNPVLKVSKPKEPRGRVRFLSDAERERLLAACQSSKNPHLYTIVVLALSTGMRQGEIMGLTWKDVDLIKGRVILNETKNDERRSVPLSSHILNLLKTHSKTRHIDTNLVFPATKLRYRNKPLDFRGAWLSALKKANIEDFRFHDLRHSAASYLAMNGASIAEIAEVLGHKTLQMVKRYTHLSESHTAGVLEAMNNKIFGSASVTGS